MRARARPGRVLTLGEALGVLHTQSSLAHATQLAVATGGAEGNVAIGLARLGVPVTWLGRIGDDGIGRRVRRELLAEGVDTVGIIDRDAPTGLLLKHSPVAGRTEVTYYRTGSAGSRLRPEDLDRVRWDDVALLHVTGITPALSRSAAASVEHAITLASAAGVPLSFDVNHRSRLWPVEIAAPVYRDIASRADIVFAGVDEARLVTGERGATPAELAQSIADLGVAQVVVKLGEKGALALVDGTITETAAVPVTVVDTVGAGDAFVAGYLAEWLAAAAVGLRLRTAVRAGAAVCTREGDWEGFPCRADLEQPDGSEPVRR